MDNEFSGVTDPIRQYAELKLLYPQLKQPSQLVEEFKAKLDNLVREYVMKTEEAFETSSLVCNYLNTKREQRCFPTSRALLDSTVSGRVCKTPFCFCNYKANDLYHHLDEKHGTLTPKTRDLFAKRWIKTEDRLWRSCKICNKITQYMQQHLRVKHKESDIHKHSLLLKDQRSNVARSITAVPKRKPSEPEPSTAKKAREVSNFLLCVSLLCMSTYVCLY